MWYKRSLYVVPRTGRQGPGRHKWKQHPRGSDRQSHRMPRPSNSLSSSPPTPRSVVILPHQALENTAWRPYREGTNRCPGTDGSPRPLPREGKKPRLGGGHADCRPGDCDWLLKSTAPAINNIFTRIKFTSKRK